MNPGKQRKMIEDQLGPVSFQENDGKFLAFVSGVEIVNPEKNEQGRMPAVEHKDKDTAFDHLWYIVTRLNEKELLAKKNGDDIEYLRFDFEAERFVAVKVKTEEAAG